MLMILQEGAQAGTTPQAIEIAKETVIAIIISSTAIVIALLWLIGRFATVAPGEDGPLRYGNFFVVIFGIMAVLIGFLVAFPLVVSRVFEDPTQVIALLSALFGTIVGLVGTYFGVKSSSDASEKAQKFAEKVAPGNTGLTNGSSNRPVSVADGGVPNVAASGTAAAPTSRTTAEEADREHTVAGSRRDAEVTGPQGGQRERGAPPRDENQGNP